MEGGSYDLDGRGSRLSYNDLEDSNSDVESGDGVESRPIDGCIDDGSYSDDGHGGLISGTEVKDDKWMEDDGGSRSIDSDVDEGSCSNDVKVKDDFIEQSNGKLCD